MIRKSRIREICTYGSVRGAGPSGRAGSAPTLFCFLDLQVLDSAAFW